VELKIPVVGGVISGEDSGGDGFPVVLVHADWTDSRLWSPLRQHLRASYRVISYDQSGHGASGAPVVPYTWAADLRMVLDHAGADRAVVVAHSGAGGPAVCLALAEPAMVAALVLVAPGTQDYPWPGRDPFLVEAGKLTNEGDQDGMVALGLRTWAPAGHDAQVKAQFRGAVSAWFAGGHLRGADPAAFSRLAEVTVPAVMAVGDLEYPMVLASARAMASRIPGCGTILVPGADHLLPLRAPGRLAEIVAATAEHAG
jgi:3-oxoadipate enol-lactonase